MSFLLRDDHGFLQAPYETIDASRYAEMIAKVKPLNHEDVSGGVLDSLECQSGACPVR